MCTVGIDPGLSGAIVAIDDEAKIIGVFDMPIVKSTQANGKELKRVDALALHQILTKLAPRDIIVEQVNAMPGQGVTSCFSFGHAFGSIQAIAAISGASCMTMRPNIWKPIVDVSAVKDTSRNRAIEYSGEEVYFKLKKHNDRAEAYLLAYICRLIKNGSIGV